jgi:hypothetical protein
MATIKALTERVGGLSNPSKMPGWSYGTPAKDCKVGSILRKIQGSVCEICYAFKGMYVFPVVKAAQQRRLDALLADLDLWKRNMRDLLILKYRNKKGKDRVFRWHDSGDVQSQEHLEAIVWIANEIPTIKFWLPSREYAMIRSYGIAFPDNLVVRLSAPKVGKGIELPEGVQGSTVDTGKGFKCGAYTRDGICGPCRACWDKSIEWIDYPSH